ncbi:MAG TPA: hypothetical protein VFY83_15150 [Anaerolineales bacterium]|nr:hypothetical protein [Anaerolineales bacterium]
MTLETKNKWLKFLGGFVGWFLISTLVFAAGQMGAGGCLWVLYLLINVVVMMALAVRKGTQWISLGIVSAMAVNFFVAMMLRPFYEAICFFPVTYTGFPVRPATQSVAPNHLPIGYHDGSTGSVDEANCVVFGWAVDPDNRDEDINVRVFIDGKAVAETVANAYRPDLNVPDGCPGGTCGFLIELWELISHNEQHSVWVKAQDVQTDMWIDLSATPKRLECRN